MDKIIIGGITMPRTRALEVGGSYEAKKATMASGKVVRDITGWRREISASWEWLPNGLLAQLIPLARSGDFVDIQYPDPADGDTSGKFSIEIGNQKVFRYRNGEPYWYNVELKAIAQEVIRGEPPPAAVYNAYRDVRFVELGFVFGVVAPEAAATAQASSSAQSPASQIDQTHDNIERVSAKYGTLEHNLFVLDGSFELYPDNLSTVQVGWQSADMSGADETFESNPWLEFVFDQNQDSFGFMLMFDDKLAGCYPAEVITTAYDAAGAVLSTMTTYPDSWKHTIEMPVQDYRRVRFEFVRTNVPFRRVRVCEAVFGIKYEYGADNTTSISVKQSVSPWAESLPSAEVTATIDNSGQLYNMINPAGLYGYLQDGQYMEYFAVVDGDRINMGRQYFTGASSEDGGLTAKITFNDWLYALDDIEYNDGESGMWTLSEAVATILTAARVSIETVFDDTLDSVVIRKCIPQNTSSREALRLCAQAAMCTCRIDRQNRLHFSRPEIGAAADEWTPDVQRQDAQIVVGQLYNVVKLTRRDEFIENAEDEIFTAKNVAEDDFERVKEVDNPLVSDGEAVAAWILGWAQRRVSYDVSYRGNPALCLLDTVQINDVYGVNGKAILTEHNFDYDGGLKSNATAIR